MIFHRTSGHDIELEHSNRILAGLFALKESSPQEKWPRVHPPGPSLSSPDGKEKEKGGPHRRREKIVANRDDEHCGRSKCLGG